MRTGNKLIQKYKPGNAVCKIAIFFPFLDYPGGQFYVMILHEISIYDAWIGNHSTDRSNELPDLHTTQTWASEVLASVGTEWLLACLHKLLPKGHLRGN